MSGLQSEDDLIARHFAPLAGPGGLGLRDDAALVDLPADRSLVVTKDALVAGVHFFADDAPGDVARKALRVNLSDLAAKGADPVGYLLALAMPDDCTDATLAAFAVGLKEDAARFGLPLLGGDTVRTPGPLMVSVTALGSVPKGRMIPRTGVRAGDALYVTGTIGDGALGLQVRLAGDAAPWRDLDAAHLAHLRARYLLPQPRHALTPALRAHASGGMDVSDGLVGDLGKMLRVSGVTARIDVADIPLSPAAQAAIAADPALLAIALTGGDDYELLVSVPPDRTKAFDAASADARVAVTRIGTAISGNEPTNFLTHGKGVLDFARKSFSHF